MVEIVVYLTDDYTKNESIFVNDNLSKDEITDIINERFDYWFSYDIMEK